MSKSLTKPILLLYITNSPDERITVAVCKADENGMPGDELTSTSLKVSELVDASVTYNDPTTFTFANPAEVEGSFFVVVSGFPNNSDTTGEDDIAMYAFRRGEGTRNTAFHLLEEYDDNYRPTGETNWYAQDEDPTSFAIAPRIKYISKTDGIAEVEIDNNGEMIEATYYRLDGVKVSAGSLTPGIYIRKCGSKTEKIIVK